MLLYVGLLYLIAGFAGEDDQLAYHVGATEVDTGGGLGIAVLLGQSYGLGEWDGGRQLVEDVVERATEYRLNLEYLVARVAQVVDGADDGQSGSHIGLKAIDDATLQRRVLQSDIALIV